MQNKEKSYVLSEHILYALIWSFFGVFPIILEYWENLNGLDFEWSTILRWWSGMIPLAVLFLVHHHILMPRLMKRGMMMKYGISILSILIVYGIYLWITHGAPTPPDFHDKIPDLPPHGPGMSLPFEHEIFSPPHHEMGMPPQSRPPRPFPLPELFNIVLAIMTIGLDAAISLSFGYSREKANRKDLENFRLQEELKYLKQQVSPHFLMNTLNNIHELAEEDSKSAQEMILELSHLMRYVLYDSEREMSTLAGESEFICSYVNLMRLRYPEDLISINLSLPECTSDDISIPHLLFISFIENAFKHGVSYQDNNTINIQLREVDGKILFTCENTKPSNQAKTDGNHGVGLANVRRRLDLIYGTEYSLRIDDDKTKYLVTLILPWKKTC